MKGFKVLQSGMLGSFLILGSTFVNAQDIQKPVLPEVQLTKDVSGTWVGQRQQFDKAQRSFVNDFEYIFELKQKGNAVLGTSYIKNSNGDFAEIKFRGLIVGEKLHFEEYQIIDEQRPEYKVWCLKVGELTISEKNDVATLEGETNSFMADYYIPCSGGFTSLERIDDYNTEEPVEAAKTGVSENEAEAVINSSANTFVALYPNPYTENTTISYQLKSKEKVVLSVFDLSGKLICTMVDEVQEANSYQVNFSGHDYGINSGVLMVELKVGDEIYSKQLVQVMR